ncbi:MAG TPA: ribosome maturation factor RimM [Spirochaetota bacterium]|nr:ribosome maturation factor RimM [Spirochaetota bacterium]
MIPEKDYLRIARITGSHGLHGEVKVYVITDIPERFAEGKILYFGFDKASREYRVEGFRPMKGRILLLKLEGIDSRNDSDMLRGMDIFIQESDAESGRDLLDKDSFFYYDLIGCTVYLKGKEFGTVIDIMEAGAGDILVIEDSKSGRVMVPFVDSMVDTARIKEKIIDINPVEGLFDI